MTRNLHQVLKTFLRSTQSPQIFLPDDLSFSRKCHWPHQLLFLEVDLLVLRRQLIKCLTLRFQYTLLTHVKFSVEQPLEVLATAPLISAEMLEKSHDLVNLRKNFIQNAVNILHGVGQWLKLFVSQRPRLLYALAPAFHIQLKKKHFKSFHGNLVTSKIRFNNKPMKSGLDLLQLIVICN